MVDAILGALAAVARDDPGRIVIQEAGGVPLIIKLMDGPPDVVRFTTPSAPRHTHIHHHHYHPSAQRDTNIREKYLSSI